jgi:hypothetical protein
MDESVLVAHGREFERRPLAEWQTAVRHATHKMRDRLAFMTIEHHAVRNFAVTGLPQFQRPLSLAQVAAHVNLPASRVQTIIEDLERNLFFLVRNTAGEVAWAFPVTADHTLHGLQFSTGERTFGACAEDAFAAAFVLGRLLHRQLSVEIRSICGQSDRPLGFTIESNLSWRVHREDAQPLLFVPSVDWEGFSAPNIIDDY